MNIQETKDTLEKFRAWIIRFNRDLKDPDLVRKYMDEADFQHKRPIRSTKVE